MSKLELKFDPGQLHQLHAVRSIVDLFDGFERQDTGFVAGEEIIPNFGEFDALEQEWLTENLQLVQRRNNDERAGANLNEQSFLELDDGLVLQGVGVDSVQTPHFTVEMETGTGKTYVYFRTMRELFEKYGFRKFIVVVPSVAIFEGVKKTFEVTKSHFSTLYGNDPVTLIEYDGNQLGRIREFASSQFMTILLITKQAFDKAGNNFYKATEKLAGELKPYEYVQKTRPIVILDEPQNMDSERGKEAVRTLLPLFVLRYSATHRKGNLPNLVYRLTPVDAFNQGLVKQIEVIGVAELSLSSANLLRLEEVTRNPIRARIRTTALVDGQLSESALELRQGDDLYAKTRVDAHRGKVIDNITVGSGTKPSSVTFTDGSEITSLQDLGTKEEIFRAQIERTVETHIERQKRLRRYGIKVLSLFFIDRVANYVAEDGVIRKMFDEAFERYKKRDPEFARYAAEEVRAGYFAKKRDKTGAVVEYLSEIKSAKDQELAKDEYQLIMKDKEKLLTFPDDPSGTPVAFVFAHSALKEGWDNPNVFQICTLNTTQSDSKKRQEIGRGLRLCVDQTGERPEGFIDNILTVVANDSYETYVDGLQREYEADGDTAPPRPKRPIEGTARRRKDVFESRAFQDFWGRLEQQLDYDIRIDTPALIGECVAELDKLTFPEARLQITKGRYYLKEYELSVADVRGETAYIRFRDRDTHGDSSRWQRPPNLPIKVGQALDKDFGLKDFKGFRVHAIEHKFGEDWITFENGEAISQTARYSMSVRKVYGESVREQKVKQEDQPIPDVIGRAAAVTKLSKKTVLAIFQGMAERQRKMLLKNPEAFTNLFCKTISDVLASHVAERLEFRPKARAQRDMEELFPAEKKMPQKELISGPGKSLYDLVQIDSEVERHFVERVLGGDAANILAYFKFPPKFKIGLPKVIGNYNPDWAIVRRGAEGEPVMELVRETKGTDNLEKLRFGHERRKIEAAKRYFTSLGLNYRVVTSDTARYWEDDGRGGVALLATA